MGDGSAAAPAVPLRCVESRNALRLIAVQVLRAPLAGLLASVEESIEQRAFEAALADTERTRSAAPVVGAAVAGLAGLEVRQAPGVAPFRQAKLVSPTIVVERMPTHIDHRVDRRRAADDLAARHVDGPVEKLRLRLGHIVPVDARIEVGTIDAGRDMDHELVIHGAGLEDENTILRIGAELGCQHAARRAGANDHIVVARCLGHRLSPCAGRSSVNALHDVTPCCPKGVANLQDRVNVRRAKRAFRRPAVAQPRATTAPILITSRSTRQHFTTSAVHFEPESLTKSRGTERPARDQVSVGCSRSRPAVADGLSTTRERPGGPKPLRARSSRASGARVAWDGSPCPRRQP